MEGWGLGLGLWLGAGASDRERAWRHFPHPAAAARNRGQGHSQWAAANNNDNIIVTLADAWPNLLPPSVPRCWHRLHESKDVLFVRVPHGLFTFLAKRFAALLVAQHIPLLVLCKTLTPPPPHRPPPRGPGWEDVHALGDSTPRPLPSIRRGLDPPEDKLSLASTPPYKVVPLL